MKILSRLLAVLLLASWLVVYLEHRSGENLRRENASLRAEIARWKESENTFQSEIARRDSEIQKLNAEAKEVHKLRSRVNLLARENEEAEKVRQENQQLRAANVPPQPAVTEFQPVYVARENWQFAGYSSPEASLQSLTWAMREGDTEALLSSLAPEVSEKLREKWNNETAEQIKAGSSREVAGVTGFRIDAREFISDDEMVLTVSTESRATTKKFVFKRFDSDWKMTGKK